MADQESFAALVNLARRLRGNPRYMSYVLARYQQQENIGDEDLARELGTLPALAARLALCKRPASSSVQFAEEVREIADYTLTDEAQLAGILRQVDTLEKLTGRSTLSVRTAAEEYLPVPYAGMLAAARDCDEPEADEASLADEERPENEA
jgi:hypothetical protein